jgi:lactoylglutathione lyase
VKLQYAIVFVRDMKRSIAFYRDVVGLPLRFETPEWTEFATEGATLALHAEGPAAGVPEATGATRAGLCRPGFHVSDLDAFHARMVAHGVHCVQEPTDSFGVRLAQYADPDGLIVSVSGTSSKETPR